MSGPLATDFVQQARANRRHAEWLLASRAEDPTALQWAVTAAYYSALHALNAYLTTRGVTVRHHASRAKALTDPATAAPTAVLAAYLQLEDMSRAARYDLWQFTEQDVRDLLDQELAAVAAFTGM